MMPQRQREVLKFLAEGHTTKEIAFQLHLSPKTVEWHRSKLYLLTGLNSVALLTQFALKRHLARWVVAFAVLLAGCVQPKTTSPLPPALRKPPARFAMTHLAEPAPRHYFLTWDYNAPTNDIVFQVCRTETLAGVQTRLIESVGSASDLPRGWTLWTNTSERKVEVPAGFYIVRPLRWGMVGPWNK